MSDPKQPIPFTAIVADVKTVRNDLGVVPVRKVKDAVAVARQEAVDAGREEGYRTGIAQGEAEGFRRGRNKGLAQAEVEAHAALSQVLYELGLEIQQVRDDLEETLVRYFAELEERATDLAMNAVRRLLATELETSRASAKAIVQEALREVTHSSHAVIRVNPKDSRFLTGERDRLLAATANLKSVEFISDPSIDAGCIIETEGGTVNATVAFRLEKLEGEVKEREAA